MHSKEGLQAAFLGVDRNPVAGASITVNGTTTGTQTDAAGNFTLNVPGGKNALTISSVGFETQNVAIPGSNNLAVTLGLLHPI
ncbi:MAG: carboxypeptidase-like regulatory domain-containing protein [Segetibacter sp.]